MACGAFDLNPNHFQNFQNDFKNEIQNYQSLFQFLDKAKVSLVDNNLKLEVEFTEGSDHILWRFIQAIDREY